MDLTDIKTDPYAMNTIQPVATAEREIFMDVLRGFAIPGIFIANLNSFSWYSPDTGNTGPWLLPKQDHTNRPELR